MKSIEARDIRQANIFKALAHPVRVRILRRLLQKDCCASEAEACLGISQPNVSQHLRVLRLAGIIAGERRKTRICYRIADERIRNIFKHIG